MNAKPKTVNALLLPIRHRFEVYGDNGRWKAKTMEYIDFEGVELI